MGEEPPRLRLSTAQPSDAVTQSIPMYDALRADIRIQNQGDAFTASHSEKAALRFVGK